MILCDVNNGIYEGNILVQSGEIEERDVTEIVEMGIVLTKMDIMLHEIVTIRSDCVDHAQMYKILEDKENGNIMKSGTAWRSRAMKTLKIIFLEVVQASRILEMYEAHKAVFTNFIEMNQKNEGQEHIGIGWIELFDKHIKVKTKMTKKDCNHIAQRVEIFQTKTRILKSCEETSQLGE